MQSVEHVVSFKRTKTFRSDKVAGMFDVSKDDIAKSWKIDHDIADKPWSIGAIIGPSGSGKTTIAKKLFGDIYNNHEFSTSDSIVDGFPKEMDITAICSLLSQVGFSSPPSWLLPYRLLSNGQQMRCQLAHGLSLNKLLVFDEFTSVVDRTVAAACSNCVSKYVRKNGGQFVAVACHYDILEWLRPDWIIDMADSTFSRRVLRRPSIAITIRKADKSLWRYFKDHHYMSNDINSSARVFIADLNGSLAGFCADIHFPHPRVKNMRRIHRIVTLPDFQGFGIGPALLAAVAEHNQSQSIRTAITTSHPGLCASLNRSDNWRVTSAPGLKPPPSKTSTMGGNGSFGRLTASFEWLQNRMEKT